MNSPPGIRRIPDTMMRGNHGNLAPQRKVSLEHSSGSYASGMPHGVPMMSMHSNNMHQIHMNEMMMADYQTMMGLAPDPYDVSFMPMHPSEATSMGTNNFMMDQMMDFPNSRFVSPLCPIPRRRPSRDVMLPEVRSQMDDHELLEMQQQMNTPQMFQQRLMIQNNARHTNLNNDAHGSYLSANPSIPPPSTGPNTDTIQSFQQSVKRKERAPSSTSFPTKLYKIMADPQYESYIAWLPHGRAWRVLKPKGLEEDVIPKFFRSDRYASFMRQVNGWGFKRITEGPDLNAYYHELFLRGLPQVCIKMRRPQKGDGGQSRDIGQHPDFYKISLFAPLPRGNSDSPDASKGGLSNNDQRQRRHDSSHHGMQSTLSVTEDGLCIKTKSTQQSNLDERLGGSIPAVNDKPIRVDDSGSTGEVSNEVAHFSVSAITRSPPTRDCASDSASDGFGIRTPNDYLDGPDNYGNLHRAASGASLSSWNETEEQDLMWGGGMSGGSSIASPGDGYNAGAARLANQSFSQVTPPGRLRPIPRVRNSNIYGHHSRQQSNVRAPFGLHNFEETVDSTGLSVADLCYLTQQNRILLSQARRCEDQAS